MNYYEAIVSTVTANEAREEILAHGCCFDTFQAEQGTSNTYTGADVLAWLGY